MYVLKQSITLEIQLVTTQDSTAKTQQLANTFTPIIKKEHAFQICFLERMILVHFKTISVALVHKL